MREPVSISITMMFFVAATIILLSPLLAERGVGDILMVLEIRSQTLFGRIPSGGATL